MGERLILGDSLEKLKELPDNSVDACVTDPPYGLAFMGKKWDYDVPSVELWREVLRVLKPGGHLLSFGGTRTYHRLACAIEDAGFEIRDQIQWIYGSGFPKSLDVSKAIDKAAGAGRKKTITTVVRERESFQSDFGGGRCNQCGLSVNGTSCRCPRAAPATNAAKQWQGWGTALKPANEPIVLARKPLERGLTVAENVQKWGVGAINVDASRIEAADQAVLDAAVKRMTGNAANNGAFQSSAQIKPNSAQGRWPANVLFDKSSAAMLDEQSGVSSARGGNAKTQSAIGFSDETGRVNAPRVVLNDSGGASRFFYIAKCSKRERNAGLEGMPERKSDYRPGDEEGRNTIRERLHNSVGKVNHHPTVKPIKLMEYLIKLVTPPNGQVLDPFMGSGSTGCAARRLGFNFIGIEREKEYFEIAKRRIEHWANEAEEQESQDPDQLEMTL